MKRTAAARSLTPLSPSAQMDLLLQKQGLRPKYPHILEALVLSPGFLGRYCREEGLISLEEAVHKMTGLPASYLGLKDRGVIREGLAADITIFDPRTVIGHCGL